MNTFSSRTPEVSRQGGNRAGSVGLLEMVQAVAFVVCALAMPQRGIMHIPSSPTWCRSRQARRNRGKLALIGSLPVMAVLITTLATSGPVHAAVFTCPAADVGCLIAAINMANGNGQDDTIQLQAATYSLTAEDNGTDGPNGLPSITSPITIIGAGANTTVIERDVSAPDFRIVHVAAGGILTLEALAIRRGSASSRGGGIANRGTLMLRRSTISDNSSDFGGGGIFNTSGGTLSITDSTISMNRNDIFGGGGILNDGSTLTITNSTISDNTSGAGGGTGGAGIYNRTGSTLTITNSTISGNTNSSGNGRGGGIFSGGTVNLNNVTITNNTAQIEGGGVHTFGSGIVNLKNTLIAGNFDSGGTTVSRSPDCAGTLTSQGFNLIGNSGSVPPTFPPPPACVIVPPTAPGDQVGTESAPIDPRLEPLALDPQSLTRTETHAPQPGSPVIDAGDPAGPGSGGTACEATDQRGFDRQTAGRCDIGAFELGAAPPPLVMCAGQIATIEGTPGNDVLPGTNGDDVIHGLGGHDIISAGDGDDTVCGGDGNDAISGGTGKDQLFGDAGRDTLRGGIGDDTLSGGQGRDQLFGEAGRDTVRGGIGDDTLSGGQGRDQLFGEENRDILRGGVGDDTLSGGPNGDQLFGQEGRDTLRGGRDADTLLGQQGNDALDGGLGFDQCIGGLGTDNALRCERVRTVP
jgi:Ca2+-binding RTX toxin-like protein